ncbi:hypothetical protein LshimejAT787_1003980 [Lyophyllum shimeji]|uniref:Uncharacterized protein n=1 Tax=Lyophyllum shimeji TaxID=47721 RepID=A0A9P3UQM0_LYOSH|nr:hypothetical protein LshimejAT787_1003980 [Lyophyllum shimeji]
MAMPLFLPRFQTTGSWLVIRGKRHLAVGLSVFGCGMDHRKYFLEVKHSSLQKGERANSKSEHRSTSRSAAQPPRLKAPFVNGLGHLDSAAAA